MFRSLRRLSALAVVFFLAASPQPRRSLEVSGRAPSIAFDRRGELHLVFIDDAGRVAHRSGERTTIVSPPTAQPDAHGEVTPLLVVRDDNSLVTIYPDRTDAKRASRLVAQRSTDGGKTWSAPIVINDDGKQASHSFADAAANGKDDIVVAWLDNRSGHQGVITTVVRNDKAAANTSVDSMTCECCRTAVFRAADDSMWLAYRDHADGNIRNMIYARSTDGGATFKIAGPIADDHWSVNGCPESGPRLTQTADGKIWAAGFNGGAPAIELARFNGRSFDGPQKIAVPDSTYTLVNHPDLGTLPDGRLIVVYEATQRDGASVVMSRAGDAEPVVVARDAMTPRYARRGNRAAIAFTQHANGKTFVRVVEVPKS